MRKYLDDINVIDRPDLWNPDDKRQKEWEKERDIYGFDERELWSLDRSFYLWLYERLKRFLDLNITTRGFTFTYKKHKYSQKDIIQMIIERLEFYFSEEFNDCNKKHYQYVSEISKLWAIIISSMWI